MSFATFCRPSAVVQSVPEVEFAEWREPEAASEIPAALSTRITATVLAPRKELLDRLKTAAKGDGVRLSVNGSVDLSILYGSKYFPPREKTDHADASDGGFSPPDHTLELRDSWERSGELAEIVPAARLSAILAKSKCDSVRLELFRDSETGDHGCIVRTDKSEFTLPTDDGEFPADDAIDTQSVVLVDAADLLRAILQTEYATDCESTRYALGGVSVELAADGVTMAATDSRRLAKISVPAQPADGFQPINGVIPWQAMQLLAAQLKKTSGPVAVALSADRFAAESESWTVAGRLLDGRFPDYHRIIPTQFNHLVKFNRAELLESLETVQLATDEESRGVDFTFHPSHCELTAKTSTGCAGRVSVPTETADECGEPAAHAITFDPRYIVDYVKRQSAEFVVMATIDHESAGVIEADGGATYVVMPLGRGK